MILTITTTYTPASDIGYLLHKNPANLNTIDLPFGSAHIFYPEANNNICTVSLLLDIDPIKLVRKGAPHTNNFTLDHYVNDRPYTCSSFMSVAINRAFGTLLSGKSKQRQDLVDTPLPLEATLHVILCHSGEKLLRKLFEPLGYTIDIIEHPLDKNFPEWGKSHYFTVTLKHTCPLRELLIHLYVLIPVLDTEKHYWVGNDEVEKLIKFGENWLNSHPEKKVITSRYLKKFDSLTNIALEKLSKEEPKEEKEQCDKAGISQEEQIETKINLNQQRMEWVIGQLKKHNAKRIIDLGCGEGKLLSYLLKDNDFEYITGCDVSSHALEIAKSRLKIERLPQFKQERINLIQTALTYRDKRISGYDAATLLEVIEHIDLYRLDAFKQVVFEFAQPSLVIITTPNREYNALFESLKTGKFRHNDHRFEWTRKEFQDWAQNAASQFGYSVTFEGIGDRHEALGTPTQAGVFIKND